MGTGSRAVRSRGSEGRTYQFNRQPVEKLYGGVTCSEPLQSPIKGPWQVGSLFQYDPSRNSSGSLLELVALGIRIPWLPSMTGVEATKTYDPAIGFCFCRYTVRSQCMRLRQLCAMGTGFILSGRADVDAISKCFFDTSNIVIHLENVVLRSKGRQGTMKFCIVFHKVLQQNGLF